MTGAVGNLAKWILVAGSAVALMAVHSAGVVAILIVLVVVQSIRLARSQATSMVLAEQLVEAQDQGTGTVGEAAADALVRAGYEIGSRDAAFEIMRQAGDDGAPGRVKARRTG